MIDVRKVRTIGKLLLKLETRNRAGSEKKILFLFISYLIPGCFLPFMLARQNVDPTGFEYTFLTYLFYTLIISFTVSSELDNLIVSQNETDIFSALPVDSGLLAGAKSYMLNRYIFMLVIPLFGPGAVFYYRMMNSVPRAIMYFAAGYMLCMFTINSALLVYSIALRVLKTKRLSVYTLAFQVILIFLLIIGYQFVSYGISGRQPAGSVNYLQIIQKNSMIDLFPQSWYAFLSSRVQYEFGISLLLKIALPFFIFYLSYLSLKMYLEENLGRIKEKIFYADYSAGAGAEIESKSPAAGLIALIESVYLRNSSERSSFALLKSMFSHDKAMKLNIIPMIVIPAGLTIFALVTNQLTPPFDPGYFIIKPVFHISIMISAFVVLNTSVLGVKISSHPGASWVYDSYPVGRKKRFKNGIRKFFSVYLILPLCTILGILFSFKMPVWQAALDCLFIFASANLYNSLFNLFTRALPFTKENTLINSAQRITGMLYPIAFGTGIVFIQLYVYNSVFHTVLAIIGLFTISFWINYFGFVRTKRTESPA